MRSEVQIFPGPPTPGISNQVSVIGCGKPAASDFRWLTYWCLTPGGAIAQLGERLLCKQEVVGSIPSGSTRRLLEVRVLKARVLEAGLPAAKGRQLQHSSFVKNSIRAPSVFARTRRLSDIVKRRSIRALRVAVKSRAVRYSRHFQQRYFL